MFNAPWRTIGKQPPVVRRWTFAFIGASVTCLVIAIAAIVVRESLGLPKKGWSLAVPMIFGFLPMAVLWPLAYWRTRWIRTAFRESGGRLCVHCAYDLSVAGVSGRCPECGKPFDRERDAEVWRHAGFGNKSRGSDRETPDSHGD
jgi:hypothetical protein